VLLRFITSLQKGFTPLHVAAKYGHLRVARLLLKRGSDPNVEGRNGLTPLHVATHYSHIAVALMLMENGATPCCVAKVSSLLLQQFPWHHVQRGSYMPSLLREQQLAGSIPFPRF